MWQSLSHRALAVVLLVPLAGSAGCESGERCAVAHTPPPHTAFSTQLHLHGSFSEGVGSIESHTHEAVDVGVAVLWWSDHDWRIQSYRHATGFDFEAWTEPIDRAEAWKARTDREQREVKGLGRPTQHGMAATSVGIGTERADAGSGSLRIEARASGTGPGFLEVPFQASRQRFPRSLAADVTLHVAIFPERVSADAYPVLRVALSEHPGHGDPAFPIRQIEYRLAAADGEPTRKEARYRIPLPFEPGVWNHYALPVTRDARSGFPEAPEDDDALSDLGFGVEARGGAEVVAHFDSLRIEQQLHGEALLVRQRELIAAAAQRAPETRQLQGLELSYWNPHLNAYGPGLALPDYDALAAESGLVDERGWIEDRDALQRFVAASLVRTAHARGNLVSYNHMFGAVEPSAGRPARSRESVLRRLLETRLYEADLLEVGYRERGGRDLEDHLWVWDELARAGLHPVGTGVSDSHGGPQGRWRSGRNNFVSWIYAASPTEADLLAGLARGRVFFGDATRFRGTLDLVTDTGDRMGRIVETRRPLECVSIQARGVPPGHEIRIVEDGREVGRHTPEAGEFVHAHPVRLEDRDAAVLRVEVRDASGGAVALSNPMVFTRALRDEWPAARVAAVPGG